MEGEHNDNMMSAEEEQFSQVYLGMILALMFLSKLIYPEL